LEDDCGETQINSRMGKQGLSHNTETLYRGFVSKGTKEKGESCKIANL